MAIENEQKVTIAFELKVEGNVVTSNIGAEPLEVTFGASQLFPKLEESMRDMDVGEKKEITLTAQEGYGEYQENAFQSIPKEQFGDVELIIGQPLKVQSQDGTPLDVTIAEVRESDVVLDLNHPLAGKELDFTVEVLSVS